jgi:hypothetical protein
MILAACSGTTDTALVFGGALRGAARRSDTVRSSHSPKSRVRVRFSDFGTRMIVLKEKEHDEDWRAMLTTSVDLR